MLRSPFRVLRRGLSVSCALGSGRPAGLKDLQVPVGTPRVLIAGASGQLGVRLAEHITGKYVGTAALATDIRRPHAFHDFPFRYLNVLDGTRYEQLVVDYQITHIVHFSALLSAVAEKDPQRALEINNVGVQNALDIATRHRIQLFIPSTIGAFGPTTPNDAPVPDLTIMRPNTIYGVTKVYAELLGEYYAHKFGTDFRCLRLPGILSSDEAGGGTTDYAQEMIAHAVASPDEEFVCFLGPDTRLPMMYLDDCIRAIDEFTSVPVSNLTQRTYNIAAMDFTPSELADCVRKYVPSLKVRYEPDFRQKIADTWPRSFDDSTARRDWSWSPEVDLDELVRTLIAKGKEGIPS